MPFIQSTTSRMGAGRSIGANRFIGGRSRLFGNLREPNNEREAHRSCVLDVEIKKANRAENGQKRENSAVECNRGKRGWGSWRGSVTCIFGSS
jgi:hypothetical protein